MSENDGWKTQKVYMVYFRDGEDIPLLTEYPRSLEKLVRGYSGAWIGIFMHKSHAEMCYDVLRENQTNQT